MKAILIFLSLTFIAAFIHAQIPREGLDLWLKTDAGIKVSANKVLSWNDQSGHNNNAVTKTINPPLFFSDQLNGYPVVRFNGEDNGMATPAFQTFPGKRGCIFLVIRVNGRSTSSGAGFGTFVSTYYGQSNTWQFGSTVSSYSYYDGVEGSVNPVSSDRPGEWGILAFSRDNDSTMNFYKNGMLIKSLQINTNQPDINSLKIGFNDSVEVLNGDIAEIIVYGRSFTGREMSPVNTYLAKKYAFTLPRPFWQSWWFYGLLALLVITTSIAITKFIATRKLKKQLAELERQKVLDEERRRISQEMHDDICAGLTQISLISEAARGQASQGKPLSSELDDISVTSRQLVDNISEIIWSLNPQHGTLDSLLAHLREQLNKLLEYSDIEYQVLFPIQIPSIELDNQQRRNILLVTKEIVHNSLKHSEARNLSVKAILADHELKFTVADDGTGFNSGLTYKGNGLKNIRRRIEELGGKLSVESEPGKGTIFTYSFSI